MAALLALGLAWGVSIPITKVATSTGHGPLGLIFWQLVFVAALLLGLLAARGRMPRPRAAHLPILLAIALLGTLIPNALSYVAVRHLPAGVYSVVISLVPMSAFAIAWAWRTEPFSARRLAGLVLGLVAVLILVLPGATLPSGAAWIFVLLGAGATICYGLEGNVVARYGLSGLDPVEALALASLVGIVLALPLALVTGQFFGLLRPWGPAEWALLATSALHAFAYAGYIWLVGRAGAVFTAQISYPVTLFGVIASMAFLGERYAPGLWLALALMLLGIFLVQPRNEDAAHA